MAFLDENVLWHLFWVIPLFFIIIAAAWKRRKRLLETYPGKNSFPADNIVLSRKARAWRYVLLFLTVVFLFLALARPFWGNRLMPYSGEGRDLLFVFDVSRSMYAQDVRPNRLEHAKYLVRELVKLNPGDRFGLIAFAGTAFLECPMTMDKTSFLQNLDELAPSSIPVGGTNIEEALKTALRAFKGAESTNRAIILVTDGDELTGESSKALDEAVKLKIPLFIAGIGDPSEPAIIRIPDGKGAVTTLRDEKGNIVNSRLNEKSLAALASKTGGIYVRSSTSVTGIKELEARIRSLDKDLRESGKQTKPIERPLYPLTAALVCFILFLLLPEVPRRKKVFFLLFFPVLFLSFGVGDLYGQQQLQSVPAVLPQKQGIQGMPPALQAGGNTLSPQVTPPPAPEEIIDPNDPFALYNTACRAHFEKKNLSEAKELYLQALSKAGTHSIIRDSAALNLGTIDHSAMRTEIQQAKNTLQKQELQKALEEVKKAIAKTEAIQELYKYGLLGATAKKAAVNQQLLLREKREAEKLQKAIEDLIKKQQEAQKNTQQALDQQQKQQQNQKQDQQKQQDQKQDQQKQQDQKQQQNKEAASRQTAKAQQSAKEMKEQAQDLGQQKMKEQAQKAEEELKKAQEAQKKDDGKKALEHLKKAKEALGSPENQNKDNKDNKDGKNNKDNRNNKDNKKDSSNDQQNQQNQQDQKQQQNQKQPEQDRNDGRQYDKKQAESLLDLMVKDEKDLKEELKARMLKNQGIRKVEKDW